MKQLLPLIALLLIACAPAQTTETLPDDESLLTEEPVAETAAPTITPTVSATPTPAPFDVSLEALPLAPGEILYWHEDELRIIGPDGSNDRRLLTGEHITIVTIGLPFTSPSDRYMAVSAMQPFVLDLQTGDIFVLSDRKESAIASFFWAPGDIFYYVWYDEGFDWKTWRVEMPTVSTQELVYDAREGGVMTNALNDTYLVIHEPIRDDERQSMLLNWRTGQRL